MAAPTIPAADNIQDALSSRTAEVPRSDGGLAGALRIRPGWIALVEILARLEREPHRWPLDRAGFQKIAYFASEVGIPTGFRHARASDGPFSTDVNPALTRLMNDGLVRKGRLGGMSALRSGPTYQDIARAYRAELAEFEPLIDRVVDLLLRMRTRESEVAATVVFTAMRLTRQGASPPFEMEIFEAVKDWKPRRRSPLHDEEIGTAIRHLNMLGWLTARPSAELPLPASELLVSNDFDRVRSGECEGRNRDSGFPPPVGPLFAER